MRDGKEEEEEKEEAYSARAGVEGPAGAAVVGHRAAVAGPRGHATFLFNAALYVVRVVRA